MNPPTSAEYTTQRPRSQGDWEGEWGTGLTHCEPL